MTQAVDGRLTSPSSTDIIEAAGKAPALEKLRLGGNAQTVLEARYLKKDSDGKAIEQPEDMFRRVAQVIAGAEDLFGNGDIENRVETLFYNMMVSGEFLPNSPTLMNAGRELGQLSACFVIPVGDSMDSIFQAVKDAAIIHKSGGGTGFSFSRLRPKNDVVRSTQGISSGPVSFMAVFDAATETIKQGGTRRGANMGILRVDHPDIRDFIASKNEGGTLSNFNISVAITDAFMKAVREKGEYNIINPRTGEITGTENACEIFDLIVDNAHRTGDPGVVFIDRINDTNPLAHIGDIESTNPCVSGDSWITSACGTKQAVEALGIPVAPVMNGRYHASTANGFFKTGRKKLYELITDKGYRIRATADHPVLAATSVKRTAVQSKWRRLGEFRPGDPLLLSNNRGIAPWSGPGTFGEGYLLGLLAGDGTVKNDTALISVWGGDESARAMMTAAEKYAMALPHRADFRGFQKTIAGRSENRLKLRSLFDLAASFGITHENGKNVAGTERGSYDFSRGFLRGLFDADGTVTGSLKKGVSIRLWQNNTDSLLTVQRMLHRLGIVSSLYERRKKSGLKRMPDNAGGLKEYQISDGHELIISKDNLHVFEELVGFTHTGKRKRLRALLKSYKRMPNRERFTAKVAAVHEGDIDDVYDVSVPGVNAFDCNGIIVHNCGEQPLLPYESCNLGSINLSHMTADSSDGPAVDWERLARTVRLAVRFLDNVIEVNRYPLPSIAENTHKTRKIGLGVMGFADMLIKLGIAYDSEEAETLADRIMAFIDSESKAESAHLAESRGAFPAFVGSSYDSAGSPPLRNATTTTIAPTGTISIIAGCSSGIEPLFALAYRRHVLDGKELAEFHPALLERAEESGLLDDRFRNDVIETGRVSQLGNVPAAMKRVFRTASEIDVEWHIRIQAAFQRHTDNAVSKTINFPREAPVSDVASAYLMAHESGLKGITIYRDGSKNSQVLSTGKQKPRVEAPALRTTLEPRPRPNITHGSTEKIITGCGNLYVTVNQDENGLCEVFCQMGRSGGCTSSQSEAISRLISIALRSGVRLEEIVSQLKGIRCPSSIWSHGRLILSCSDAVATALSRYLGRENGNGENGIPVLHPDADSEDLSKMIIAGKRLEGEMAGVCPDCGGLLVYGEGCMVCRSCGFSKCG